MQLKNILNSSAHAIAVALHVLDKSCTNVFHNISSLFFQTTQFQNSSESKRSWVEPRKPFIRQIPVFSYNAIIFEILGKSKITFLMVYTFLVLGRINIWPFDLFAHSDSPSKFSNFF